MNRIKQLLRRRKPVQENKGVLTEYMAGLHRKAADYLNAKTRQWSARQLKVMLVCFCLAVGGYCSYILLKAVVYGTGPPSQRSMLHAIPPKPLNK